MHVVGDLFELNANLCSAPPYRNEWNLKMLKLHKIGDRKLQYYDDTYWKYADKPPQLTVLSLVYIMCRVCTDISSKLFKTQLKNIQMLRVNLSKIIGTINIIWVKDAQLCILCASLSNINRIAR